MNAKEYAQYEASVKSFMEREGIVNLSTGHPECPTCNEPWNDNDECPNGHGSRELFDEPFFSHSPCDCCHRPLAGDREHATGFNPKTQEIQTYTICSDCGYYAAYGRLDDTTMDEIDD